jgi:hypothetical protein
VGLGFALNPKLKALNGASANAHRLGLKRLSARLCVAKPFVAMHAKAHDCINFTIDNRLLPYRGEARVREDILQEVGGPMLRHGIQELEGSRILVPRGLRDRPDRDLLAARFEQFLEAG